MVKRLKDTANGSFGLDGWDGERDIPFYAVAESGYRIRVNPQDHYTVFVHADDTTVVYNQVFAGIPDNRVAVFHYAPTGGRILSPQTPMVWGERYCLLWPSHLAVNSIPPEINPRLLKSTDSWKGACIQLPNTLTFVTERWIAQYLGRVTCAPGPSLRVVYPPMVTGDRIEMRPGDSMVVEVDSRNGDSVVLWMESQGMSKQIPITSVPLTLKIQFEESGLYQLFLSARDRVVDVEVKPKDIQIATVRDLPSIMFEFRNGDQQVLCQLDDETIGVFLNEVADGSLKLVGVDIPAGTSISLLTVHDVDNWLSESFASDGLEDFVYRVSGLLDIGSAFQIDGHPFGSLFFAERRPNKEVSKMSQRWRARARWLALLGQGNQSNVFRTHVNGLLELLNAEDQEVLRELALSYRLDLEPYYRQLLDEIGHTFAKNRGA